jgi:peptidoglycan/LPS O-acetylase OafA/YrhL
MMRRFEHLDGLRGVAAVIVVLGHAIIAFDFALYTGNPADSVTSWDIWLSGGPLQIPIAGHLAVCLFFAMSGFVLAGAFDATPMGVVPALVKRYMRLAIPVICTCLLSCAMLSAGWMVNHQVAAITSSSWLDVQFQQSASFIMAIKEGAWSSFVDGADFHTSYDGSLWTMQIEFAGSVGLLLICCAIKKFTEAANKRPLAYIVVFFALYVAFFESLIGLFAAGGLIRHVMPSGWRPLNARPVLAVTLVFVGLVLGTIPGSEASWTIFHAFPDPWVPRWMPWAVHAAYFWHMVGAVMMLIGLQSSRFLQSVLKSAACQWLGSISFPLYLIHIPIFMTLGCHIFLAGVTIGAPRGVSAALAIAVFVPIAILCAHVFSLAIERPAIRLLGRMAQRTQSKIALTAQMQDP